MRRTISVLTCFFLTFLAAGCSNSSTSSRPINPDAVETEGARATKPINPDAIVTEGTRKSKPINPDAVAR